MTTLSRRGLFRMWPAAASLLGFPLGGADREKKEMIVRSRRPEDFAMPLDGFRQWITPVERFFVRSHHYTPKVDLASWRLEVTGEVATPLTLTMEDVRRLPRVELVSVLECAGNGRAFYRPTIIGMQWEHGGVGNGRWAGVRLADVLRKAGLKASAQQVLLDGADVPVGTMPEFQRTIPVKKALAPETILAYEMNGEALPASHGFPLRLVAPGWAGDSWTKWVTSIRVLDREFDGFFMKTAYRFPVKAVAPGTAVDPAAMTPVESLRPKSVIATPGDGARLAPGPVTIQGAAWSGDAPVVRVDVSTDGGRTWRPAQLGREQARYAWRLWEHRWTPPRSGSYVILAKATDAAGGAQPFAPDWNPSGYLWNVVQQVRVEVDGGAPGAFPRAPDLPDFPVKARAACLGCHDADIVAGQKLTRAQWEREVDKMTRWGAPVRPEDRNEIVEFLSKAFPVR